MKPPNRTTQSHPPDSVMANNVYTDLSNCDNTSEKDTFIFNNNISTSVPNFTDSELISLYTKLKQNSTFSTLAVNTCLDTLNISFDCIGLTETWLTDHDDTNCYNMNGYTLVTHPRQEGRGGGVGIYISNKHLYKIRHDLMKRYETNNNTFIIGSIYKPPNTNIDSFNDELLSILNSISLENKNSIIMGDFNLNLTNINSHQVNDFTNNMYATGFYPTISKPTRIANHSATIIDNIFTNITQHKIHSGILYTDISDHLPTFMTFVTSHLNQDTKHSTYEIKVKTTL